MTPAELQAHLTAGTITPREAEAIYLHDIKGLTYHQIALPLRVSRQTVHERARRGHEKINQARKDAA